MFQFTSKQPAKILIYETREGGDRSLMELLGKALKKSNLLPFISAEFIQPKDIGKVSLEADSTIGLIIPGRIRGQDYHDQLKKKGLAAIQQATMNGLNIMAVCAGSYVLSRETHFYNPHDLKSTKIVENPSPVFEGKTIGTVPGLYKDDYLVQENNSPALPFSVRDVIFPQPLNKIYPQAKMAYWGGGVFLPDEQQSVISVGYHPGQYAVYHPESLPGSPVLHNPDAVISFRCGQGQALFMNIHPEVTRMKFEQNEQFMLNNNRKTELFQQNKIDLDYAVPAQIALMQHFVTMCQSGPKWADFVEKRKENACVKPAG